MQRREFLPLCLIAVAVEAGCGAHASISPVAPSRVADVAAPMAQAPSGGDIRFAAVTHDSGTRLNVEECGPSFTGIPGTHLCNREWHAAFDVTSNVDLTDGVLTVFFEQAGIRCGEVSVGSQNFAAGRERLVGTSNPVYVTHEHEGYDNLVVEQECGFPIATNRLVVQLWDPRRPAAPLLRREFDYQFTFVEH